MSMKNWRQHTIFNTKRFFATFGVILSTVMFVFYLFGLDPLTYNRMFPVFVMLFMYESWMTLATKREGSQNRNIVLAMLAVVLFVVGFFVCEPQTWTVALASLDVLVLFDCFIIGDILGNETWGEAFAGKPSKTDTEKSEAEESPENNGKNKQVSDYIAMRKEAIAAAAKTEDSDKTESDDVNGPDVETDTEEKKNNPETPNN